MQGAWMEGQSHVQPQSLFKLNPPKDRDSIRCQPCVVSMYHVSTETRNSGGALTENLQMARHNLRQSVKSC